MFRDGNRIRFERPVDATGQRWWRDAFYDPHGLTPEGMADRLTRSIVDEKFTIYRYIDGLAHTFALRVEGRLQGSASMWFVERSLDLDGDLFNADQMFIPNDAAQIGHGRRLMGDLLDTALLLGISTIGIEAERIGRYAWLRAGFLPDRGSWRNIQLEAFRFTQRHLPLLTGASELMAALASGGPTMARSLAWMQQPVPSRELYNQFGQPEMVPFGKAFFLEASPNWTGQFKFDPESIGMAQTYIGRIL